MLKVKSKVSISVQSSAGDDGHSALVELVYLLALLDGQLHGEQKILPGAVQVDWQHYLGCVRD